MTYKIHHWSEGAKVCNKCKCFEDEDGITLCEDCYEN